jgi:hypothetical protein
MSHVWRAAAGVAELEAAQAQRAVLQRGAQHEHVARVLPLFPVCAVDDVALDQHLLAEVHGRPGHHHETDEEVHTELPRAEQHEGDAEERQGAELQVERLLVQRSRYLAVANAENGLLRAQDEGQQADDDEKAEQRPVALFLKPEARTREGPHREQ